MLLSLLKDKQLQKLLSEVCVFSLELNCLEFSLMTLWNKQSDDDQLEEALLTNDRQN